MMRNFILICGFCLLIFSCNDRSSESNDPIVSYVGDEGMKIAKFKILTLNTWHWESVSYPYLFWENRLDNLAREVIPIERPAIIALQDFSIYYDGGLLCSYYYPIIKQQYLNKLLDSIKLYTGMNYLVATALCEIRSGDWDVCHRREGQALIYDPDQVNFIAYDIDKGDAVCDDWYQRGSTEAFNDCINFSFGHSDYFYPLQRGIFEFPKGSHYYVNVYNIHGWNEPEDRAYDQLVKSYNHILRRQKYFKAEQLPNMPAGPRYRLSPIFLGDFNRLNNYPPGYDTFDDYCRRASEEPPIPDIDKVFVGKVEKWEEDWGYLRAVKPADPTHPWDSCRCYCGNYSDHCVYVQEIEVGYLAE